MTHTNHTLRIDPEMSRSRAIKLIHTTLSEYPGVVMIDLVDASFPLHRDFFLVLMRRFSRDRYILRLKEEKSAVLARSFGMQVEIAGIQAEFERKYSSSNLATHNMTMLEYLWYEIKRWALYIKFLLFERKKKEPRLLQFKKTNSNIVLIVTGLIVSLTLLLFIFHFAISKTVVTITPEITVRPVTANVVYRDMGGTGSSLLSVRHTIDKKRISLPVEASMRFKLDAIDPNSAMNARWVITIYNELTAKQELRPSTRFVTPDGIVFRSSDWVTVPPSRSLNGITEMGSVEIEVVADPHDSSGKLIGARGNIEAKTDLSIPGLKFNRDKVYAKAKTNFTWGDEARVHIVTAEEVEHFQGVVAEQLMKNGREAIKRQLEDEKQKTGDDFELFIADMVAFSDMSFAIISGHAVGDTAEEIEIRGTAHMTATVFDRKATIDYMTQVFREGLLAWMDKELAIHPDTLRVSNIVSRAEDDSEIKVTMEMNTSITYDFENVTNEFTRHLKTLIAGLSQKEAIDTLLHKGRIKEVQIHSYPFWLNNVSSVIDNIEFVIKK